MPFSLQLGRVADVVVVVGVAAVDDHVAGLEHLGERRGSSSSVISPAGTITQTARGFSSFGANSVERGRAVGAVGLERRDGVREDVVADAAVPVAHEPPDDAGAHPAEPDHPELHGCVRGHRASSFPRG